jgi:YesN/AraC family two-component response regulator
VVTGYPSLEDMRATFKRKVFDYLAKPFSLAQLRQTLKNATEAYDLGRTPQDRLRGALGHRVKVLRVERNWSLKDLAAETGVSVSQLSSCDPGRCLSFPTHSRVAAARQRTRCRYSPICRIRPRCRAARKQSRKAAAPAAK